MSQFHVMIDHLLELQESFQLYAPTEPLQSLKALNLIP